MRAETGVTNEGTILVFAGGSSSDEPLARLKLPEPRNNGDFLGRILAMADVSGDGVADILAGSPTATPDGMPFQTGAIGLWLGGPGLVGTPAPDKLLFDPGAAIIDRLGWDGVQLADVTGDGVLDLFALSTNADVTAVDAGAVHVWFGGAHSGGTGAPDATLAVPNAQEGDQLGFVIRSAPMQIEDVTGDGLPDVVVGTSVADVGGVQDAGAVYLWKGGVLWSGEVAPDATLVLPQASPFDKLVGGLRSRSFFLEDVTGDGCRDIVALAPNADVPGGGIQAGVVAIGSK